MHSAPTVHAFGMTRSQEPAASTPPALIFLLQSDRPMRILSSLYAMGGKLAQSKPRGQAYYSLFGGAPPMQTASPAKAVSDLPSAINHDHEHI